MGFSQSLAGASALGRHRGCFAHKKYYRGTSLIRNRIPALEERDVEGGLVSHRGTSRIRNSAPLGP